MPRVSAKEAKALLKSMPDPKSMDAPKSMDEEPQAPPVQVIERRVEWVKVKIPLGEPPRRFDQVHIEGWLRRDEAHAFARFRQALLDRGEKTADGRPVKTNPDVLRWLMGQLAPC